MISENIITVSLKLKRKRKLKKSEFNTIEKYRDELMYYYNNEPGLSKDNKEELLIEIANINEFIWDTYQKEIVDRPFSIEVIECTRKNTSAKYMKETKRVFKSMIKVIDFYHIDREYGNFYYQVKKTSDTKGFYTLRKDQLTNLKIKIIEL